MLSRMGEDVVLASLADEAELNDLWNDSNCDRLFTIESLAVSLLLGVTGARSFDALPYIDAFDEEIAGFVVLDVKSPILVLF